MRPRTLSSLVLFAIALALGAGAVTGLGLPLPARVALLLAALLLLLFLTLRLLRWLLWSVGRRLTVSYFLIGVVPLVLIAGLLFLVAYVAAGIFLGHVYRDAVRGLQETADRSAAVALGRWRAEGSTPSTLQTGLAVAYYRDGHRVAGTLEAPERWPGWLQRQRETSPGSEAGRNDATDIAESPFMALPDGEPAVVGLALADPRTEAQEDGDAPLSVLTIASQDIERWLSDGTGLWTVLVRSDDPRKRARIQLSVGGREVSLTPITRGADEEAARAEFFGSPASVAPLQARPWIWWGEITRDFRDLANGEPVAEYIAASLNATPAVVVRHLVSDSADVNTTILVALLAVSGTLASLYLVAVAMAVYMIVGLSRAVNRLSSATAAVRAGDFSVRIPARRYDQVGELQRTFNEMTEGLEQAVARRAHQEALEAELAVARRLQESLLPTTLPASEFLDFATLFEPSAAIGGDYFDVLRLDDDRLAVVIADVSGHGLPAGLRMAMLKATLNVLVEEHKSPQELLGRLDATVRRERPRYFITCTVAIVDFRRGRVEVTNAGHPPTYRIRDATVEEILVPGSPLGALGDTYGQRELELRSGDTLVWLSDGLIEATDPDGRPFGYDSVEHALAGPAPDAATVRDRLLAAIAEHADGQPPDDDRTLVILHFRGS
ncbi:MAG: PP2C family protein-serine/threonine phosphatase [Thermoanaerobaculia bacterium]